MKRPKKNHYENFGSFGLDLSSLMAKDCISISVLLCILWNCVRATEKSLSFANRSVLVRDSNVLKLNAEPKLCAHIIRFIVGRQNSTVACFDMTATHSEQNTKRKKQQQEQRG